MQASFTQYGRADPNVSLPRLHWTSMRASQLILVTAIFPVVVQDQGVDQDGSGCESYDPSEFKMEQIDNNVGKASFLFTGLNITP